MVGGKALTVGTLATRGNGRSMDAPFGGGICTGNRSVIIILNLSIPLPWHSPSFGNHRANLASPGQADRTNSGAAIFARKMTTTVVRRFRGAALLVA